jgi:ribosomal protein L35
MTDGKTKKSLMKRLKITRKGKILKRKPGQIHFRAKQKRKKQLGKKGWEEFSMKKKVLGQYLPNN